MRITTTLDGVRRSVVVFDRHGTPVPPDKYEQGNWIWDQIPAGGVVVCYLSCKERKAKRLSAYVYFNWGFVDLSTSQAWLIARQLIGASPNDDVSRMMECIVRTTWVLAKQTQAN